MVSDMRRDTLIVALPHREWPLVPGKNLLRGIKAAELRNGLVLKISRRGGKSNGSTIVGMRDMLYGDVPSFEAVMEAIRALEKEINSL